jgi:two-component system chemotaxis sensor kinase CheA
MKKLLDYLLLPKEMTPFERQYLLRMNHVGTLFYLGHIPVFALVALANGTKPLLALVLTAIVAAGPTMAERALDNPRHVSMVHGFTAMIMGGLLVHFGQGPVQIEMHFYFFVLLALLAVFANPAVVLVAAVTVALHHLLLWLWLPASVFNYAAPVWVVAVHAAFVVLESIAVSYIARSFFDNVIGLEKIVAARTAEVEAKNRDMRLVLDNVEQGLAMIDRDAVFSSERSKAFDSMLDASGHATIVGAIDEVAPNAAETFKLAWGEVTEGFMPVEVSLDLLPKRLCFGSRTLGLSYLPIMDGERLEKCLVVLTDRTAELEREKLEAEQRELIQLADRITRDRSAVLEYVEEAGHLVSGIVDPAERDLVVKKRLLHTLKGNSATLGLTRLTDLCHELESAMVEDKRDLSESERAAVQASFGAVERMVKQLSGGAGQDRAALEVSERDYEHLLEMLKGRAPAEQLVAHLRSWKLEPTQRRLARAADHAKGLARRLGKEEPAVDIRDNGLRLEPSRWGSFWSALVHVIRNAVDHGIEGADERLAVGKPDTGHLTLETEIAEDAFVVRVRDDGRGIDFSRLAEKAKAMGLAVSSEVELKEVLFHDGVSTAESVSDVSGRGVGMGAVKAEAEKLGGRTELETAPGHGTTVTFKFPLADLRESRRPVAA